LFLDANGFPIQDFYRKDSFRMAALTGDQCYMGNSDKSLIYGGIENAEFEDTDSGVMAFGAAYGRSFLGDIKVTYPLAVEMVTMTLTYTESSYQLITGTATINLGETMADPKFVMIRAVAGSGTVNFGTDVTNIDSTGGYIILSCQTGQPIDDFVITESSALTTEIIAYQ
jgi:hypothetical protein